MKIIIATPLYPPQVGGPAKYAQALEEAFAQHGAGVRTISYSALERVAPIGLRHALYALRVCARLVRADAVLALDTWSVGLPALLCAQLLGKPCVVRIGGDFLWESYVARTKEPVTLSDFYATQRPLSYKERLVRAGTRYLLSHSTPAFTTHWQLELWRNAYGIDLTHARVVENFYPAPGEPAAALGRVFVSAGRDTALKNKAHLQAAFAKVKARHPDIVLDERILPPREHTERLKSSYAVIVSSLSEVNPNTAIEAAALRKPFIAPKDCGGTERLCGMGEFIDTSQPHALQEALERLLEPHMYNAYVEASAHLRPRTWEELAKEYALLFARGNDKTGTDSPQETGHRVFK